MKLGLWQLCNLKGAQNVEILNISVGGFRNISKTRIDFDSITALVGLNGYGKSNLISAIDFGLDFIHGDSSLRNALMCSKKGIPILKSNAGQDYFFEIEIKTKSKEQNYFINYGYSFSWQTDKTQARIKKEYLKIKKDEKFQQYSSYITRNNHIAKYRSAETGRCIKNIKIDDSSLVVSKLLLYDDLFYADIIEQINSVQYYVERHLDASLSFVPAPFVVKGFQELELQGIQSIPRAIYYLKKDHFEEYELLINSFKLLFPNVQDVEVKEIKLNQPNDNDIDISDDAPFVFTDSIFTMSIRDDRMIQPVGFESLSDGTKRIFLMLTFAIIADIKGLSMIAIEEPENSIHPGLFQDYLDIISQLIKNCKVIITSHSPYIIQYLNPRSIYIGLSDENGESSFRRIASSKIKALLRDAAEYDRSVGDYIFNILSASDSTEYIKEYIENND